MNCRRNWRRGCVKRRPSRTGQMAEQALIRLLPRLRPTDAGLLNEAQRDILCRELSGGNELMTGRFDDSSEPDANLIVAILRALEQVGDARFVPPVEKLAAGKGRAKKDARIREAAQACLPFLQARAEQGAPDADPNIPLRPATSEENDS